jgi:hypothetical protein
MHIFVTMHATVPKSAKPFFRKQETPKKGHQRVQRAAEDSPEIGKTFFLETRNPQKGTSTRAKAAEDSPEIGKTFFPETRNPIFGTVAHGFCPFLDYGHTFTKMIFKYLRP